MSRPARAAEGPKGPATPAPGSGPVERLATCRESGLRGAPGRVLLIPAGRELTGRARQKWVFDAERARNATAASADPGPGARYRFAFADYAEVLARHGAGGHFDLVIYDPRHLRRRPPPPDPGPHTCPSGVLPWLAWALGVSAWDPAAPEGARRRVVAGAAREARRRGTRAALLAVLRDAGAVFTIEERHAGPFTCRIRIHNSAAVPAADLAAIEPAVRAAGRASVRFTVVTVEGFTGSVAVAAGLGAAGVVMAFFVLEADLEAASDSESDD